MGIPPENLIKLAREMMERASDSMFLKHFVGERRKLTRADKIKLFFNKYFFCRFNVEFFVRNPIPCKKGETITFRRLKPFEEEKP
jgi:hypothetical protein